MWQIAGNSPHSKRKLSSRFVSNHRPWYLTSNPIAMKRSFHLFTSSFLMKFRLNTLVDGTRQHSDGWNETALRWMERCITLVNGTRQHSGGWSETALRWMERYITLVDGARQPLDKIWYILQCLSNNQLVLASLSFSICWYSSFALSKIRLIVKVEWPSLSALAARKTKVVLEDS